MYINIWLIYWYSVPMIHCWSVIFISWNIFFVLLEVIQVGFPKRWKMYTQRGKNVDSHIQTTVVRLCQDLRFPCLILHHFKRSVLEDVLHILAENAALLTLINSAFQSLGEKLCYTNVSKNNSSLISSLSLLALCLLLHLFPLIGLESS